jgi:polyisoprenyl-teichoic acid--peptidoglycan teichoic acid transferase
MGGIRIKAGGWVPMSGFFDDFTQTHGMPLGWIPAGEQTLNGDQALWYGRSREYVDDYSRIQRQQCVQQAMLKQLDPATLLAKFEDIANAGTKVVESNVSSSQLGSFVDLAIKAKGQDVKRLTIGPPDFDASFSTVPDFDEIHARVDQLLASASAQAAQSAGVPDDVMVVPTAGAGPVQAAGASPASLPAGLAALQQPAPSDFVPVTTTPDGEPITEEMLTQLKREGNEEAIRQLVATNGQCAPL